MLDDPAVEYTQLGEADVPRLSRIMAGRRACDRCLQWEDANFWSASDPDEILITRKQNWYRKVTDEFGPCGILASSQGLGVGFTEFALPKHFPGLDEYSLEVAPDVPFIACLTVTQEWRGHGIGQELLARAETSLRSRGYRRAQSIARTDSPNSPAGPSEFWLSCGYTVAQEAGSFALVTREL